MKQTKDLSFLFEPTKQYKVQGDSLLLLFLKATTDAFNPTLYTMPLDNTQITIRISRIYFEAAFNLTSQFRRIWATMIGFLLLGSFCVATGFEASPVASVFFPSFTPPAGTSPSKEGNISL